MGMFGSGDWAGRCGELKTIMDSARSAELAARAEALADESTDRYETAQALLFALIGRLNERQEGTPTWDRLLERATEAVAAHPMPALVAELEVMRAGAVAVSCPEDAVNSLVAAHRALAEDPADSKAGWLAWNDLAANASALGLSETALAASERARDIAQRCGLVPYEIGVRLEVALMADQHGDTDTCVRRLETLTEYARDQYLGQAGSAVSRHEGLYLEYARARLSALGGDPGLSANA